jgi:hypothetical protein
MSSYITDEEALLLQLEPRFEGETIAYCGVSQTQLSLACHYGGITVQGKNFVYIPAFDELIRSDVLDYIHKSRRVALAKKAKVFKSQQGELL